MALLLSLFGPVLCDTLLIKEDIQSFKIPLGNLEWLSLEQFWVFYRSLLGWECLELVSFGRLIDTDQYQRQLMQTLP